MKSRPSDGRSACLFSPLCASALTGIRYGTPAAHEHACVAIVGEALQRIRTIISAFVIAIGTCTVSPANAFIIPMAPDSGTLVTYWTNLDTGGSDWRVKFGWSHDITLADDPSNTYVGFTAHYVLEGTATTTKGALGGTVTSLKIQDVGSSTANAPNNFSSVLDGFSGALRFSPIDVTTYSGVSTFTGDVGTGAMLGQGVTQSPGSFTTGTTFAGQSWQFGLSGAGFNGMVMSPMEVTSLDWVAYIDEDISSVPLPASASLIVSGLLGLFGLARRKSKCS